MPIFQGYYTNLYSHKKYKGIPFVSHSHTWYSFNFSHSDKGVAIFYYYFYTHFSFDWAPFYMLILYAYSHLVILFCKVPIGVFCPLKKLSYFFLLICRMNELGPVWGRYQDEIISARDIYERKRGEKEGIGKSLQIQVWHLWKGKWNNWTGTESDWRTSLRVSASPVRSSDTTTPHREVLYSLEIASPCPTTVLIIG